MFKKQTRAARFNSLARWRRMMALGLMALAGSAAWATDFTTGTNTVTTNQDSLFINDDDGGPTVVNLNSGTISTFVNVLGGANGGVTFNMNGGTLANTNGTNSTDSFQVQETAVANIAGGTSLLPVDLSNSARFNFNGGTFNGSLTVNDTATATITGASYAGSVALFNSGRVVLSTGTIANVTNINSGTVLSATGTGNTISGNLNVNSGGTLNVTSGATLTSSGGNQGGGSQGSFIIDSGGTLNFSSGTQTLSSGANFTGLGTLQFGGATANLVGTINMDATSGSTRVSGGTLNLNSGVTLTSFGSALNVSGGIANFNTVLNVTGQLVNVSGGTFNVNSNLTAGAFNLSGGVLAGTANLTVSNLTWSGGTMNLAGSTIINSGNTATINGATTKTMQSGRIFQIDGVANFTTGTLAGNNTSVITGAGQFLVAGGTANIANTINMNSATGETRLTSGVLNINSGATITSFGSALNVTGGTVNFNSGSNHTAASFNTGLNMSGGTLGGTGVVTLPAFAWSGGTMTGAGTTVINSAGTATINGATTKTIQSGRTFQIDGVSQFTTGTLTANNTSVITGAGQFLMSGGVLNLNSGMLYSMNNITGSTSISGGTVNINSGAIFSSVGSSMSISGGTVNVNDDEVVAAPVTQSGGTIAGARNINFSNFTWTGGTMSGTGTTIASTTAIIGGSGTKTLQSNRSFSNQGSLVYSGTGSLAGHDSADVSNFGTGIWDHQTDADFTNGTGPVAFFNLGTFTKSAGTGTTTFSSNWAFHQNGGQVNANSGTLQFSGGGDSAANWASAAGATLRFDTGTFDFNTGTTLASSGTTNFVSGTNNLNAGPFTAMSGGEIRFSGGTNTIAATLISSGGVISFTGGLNTLTTNQNINAGTVLQSGGTLQGLNSLTAMNLTWSGGTMDQGGETIVDTGGVATLSGGTKTLGSSRVFTNKGALTHTAGNVAGNDSAVVNNNAGATWDLQSDADFASGAGLPATFNNAGTFTKSAGTATSQFGTNWTFHNTATGQLNVNSGTVQISGGGDSDGAVNIGAGARLLIDSNPFSFNSGSSLNGSGTLSLAGSVLTLTPNVTLAAGTYVQTAGTLQGLGNLSVANLSWTGGMIDSASTTTVLAGGTAVIGGTGTKTLGSGHVLTNNGDLVYNNTGSLAGNGGATINNNGTWDHQTDADIANGTGTGMQFNNAGSFTKSAGTGTTQFASGWQFNNSGTLNVNTGLVQLSGGGTSTGAMNIAGGARLQIDTGTYNFNSGAALSGAGTLTVASGTLNVNTNVSLPTGTLSQTGGTLQGAAKISTGNFSWSGGTMNQTGTTEILSGGAGAISGAAAKTLGSNRVLANNGSVVNSSTTSIAGNASAKINNNGSWDQQADTGFSNGTGTGMQFNNAGTFTKSAGAGVTNFASGWTFSNTGTVNVLSGSLTFSAATAQESAGTLTGGNWNVNSATLGFATAITKIGAAATVTLTGGSANVTGFAGLNQNDGYFENAALRNFTTSGAFTNNGTVAVTGGANFIVAAGQNFTNNGTVKGDSFVTTSGGGIFINNGIVSPGNSPGSLNFVSNFQQTGSGAINIEIGGTTAGSQYDQLSVGAASLNGTLSISLINGFDPGILDSFQVLNYSSRTGTFSNVTGLHYSATERLNVVYNANNVLLVNSFVGDFNLDGTVGVADIDQLTANFGGSNLDLYDLDGNAAIGNSDLDFLLNSILHRRRGDADLDGDVDTADLSALRTNLGSPNHSWANGNFDGDLDVDAADLSLFRSNIGLPPPGLDTFSGSTFGGAGSLSGSSVPEPSALALLALGGVALLRRRRR